MFRAGALTLAFAVLALGSTSHADNNATFFELPYAVLPSAIASNSTVVGGYYTGGGFFWMPTSGDIFMGGIGASSVSRDGRTIVGAANDARGIQNAAIWQRAAEWKLLGSIAPDAQPCDAILSSANGTSADGKVIVGLAWNGCKIARAFRWEASTGMVDLGSSVAGQSSRADGVSGDGRVVVGFQEHETGFRQGARWIDGKQTIIAGPEPLLGEANAANTDGSIIVGQGCRPFTTTDQSAWMWTASGGVQCLPVPRFKLANFYVGAAYATSDDGRVIVGAQTFGLDSDAVIWIDKQPYYLKDYLRDHGVPNAFQDWINTGGVHDVSRDGRMLVGWGAGPRGFKGYVVILGGK